MKSKFKFWAYFLASISIFFSILLGSFVIKGDMFNPKVPLVLILLISAFFLFVWIWLIFGELRLKVIQVKLGYDSFEIKRYLGLGPTKTIYYQDLEGYRLSILSSNSGSYEYLYMIVNNKKVAKISEYYQVNYKDLKDEIIALKIKNLGFEPFRYLKELKEMFEKY